MMQLRHVVKIWPILVIALLSAASAGRVEASEPVAKPLSVKKNTLNTWELKKSTFDGMEVRMTLGQISDVQTVSVPEHGRFLSLAIDGYATVGEIGTPALPAYIQIIELPQGAEPVVEMLRDKVEIVDLSAYGDHVPLYPMQAPVSKGSKPAPAFAYSRQAYAAKGYQGQALVRVEIMGESRGVRLAKLIVSPVEYEPSQNRLRVHTDIAFEIRFEGADYDATQAKKRRYQSKGFQMAGHLGVNAAAFRLTERASKAVKAEDQPLRYAIVADPKFRDSLQGFAEWKRQQGYDVVEAYTSDENVGNTSESIRNYLKTLYDRATEAEPAPTYVLLVGDTKEIPPFPSREKDPNYNRPAEHVTDLYFVEYTDDKLPEAYIGRFSATTVDELMPQIRKTMYMSRLVGPAADFIDTTLLVAGNDSRYNLSHLNPALRYIESYAAAEEDVAAFFYPAPTSSTGEMEDEIIARISAGAGLICYTGHGMQDEWGEPKISIVVLKNKIFNKDKYPMMIGNCCLTGAFDFKEACFGEELLRGTDKGAVVYIGATNSSYFDEDFYWAVGLTGIASAGNKTYTYENTGRGAMDCFFHTHGEPYGDWAVTASDIIYKGNMSVESSGSVLTGYYWEIYELFGDPSYRPYKKKPVLTPIDCAEKTVVGLASLEVRTAPYAQLSLYGEDGIVAVVSADGGGEANVPITDIRAGEYKLYAGASGYADNEVTVMAELPQGKFMFVESLETYDGDRPVTAGQYGKRYDVSLKLKNLGTETVNGVQVRITSDDAYVEAGEPYTHAVASEPGSTVELDGKLYFTVSPDIPDNHLVRYKVELTLDGASEPIARNFRMTVGASDLHLVSAVIDDAESTSPNGVLDAGETVKVLLTVCNGGSTAARAVKAAFASEKDYLIFPAEPADWGTIEAGDTLRREFMLSAKPGNARYDVYTVVCALEADGRKQELTFSSYIDPVIETFETGDFSFVAWDTASDWLISDSAAHGGRFCAASAYIDNRDTSRLRLKVDVKLDDEVGFYYRTSTEGVTATVGDFLVFSIDGRMQGRWNRETPWTYVSYPVPAGEHTLEWLYVKDNSDAAGADRVWIDDVRLPVGSHAPMTPNECVSDLSAAGEPLFTVIGGATYELNLRFKAVKAGRGRLYLLNMAGENVRTLAADLRIAEGESDYAFSTAGLKPGLYVCVFEGADGRAAVKFIKR